MRIHQSVTVLAGMLILPGICDGKTYVVDPNGTGDFPMIQDAINAAVDGDIIELTNGVYSYPPNTSLRFHGKEVTLESQSGNVDACILDGFGNGYLGSAISVRDGEGPGCIIRGLTMRGFGEGVFQGGGVIIYNASSPTIQNCTIIECYQESGGGFLVAGSSSPQFTDCRFRGNRTDGNGGGGQVTDTAHVVFERCLFAGNQARFSGAGLGGGLIVGPNAEVTLVECTIGGNVPGAGDSNPLLGGGLYVFGDAILMRSILWGNCNGEAFVSSAGSLSFECCVVDTAGIASSGGAVVYVGQNWFTDPLFCDPVHCDSGPPTILGDYTVDASSPALLAPCGPIGAFGEGCGGISIEPSSWGRIKGIYRLSP